MVLIRVHLVIYRYLTGLLKYEGPDHGPYMKAVIWWSLVGKP